MKPIQLLLAIGLPLLSQTAPIQVKSMPESATAVPQDPYLWLEDVTG